MINKRILYETLSRAFYPDSVVAYSTTSGIRTCVNDPLMVDYDIICAIDPQLESKTWVEITSLKGVPRIAIKINDFYVAYDLGDTIDSIENQNPSFRSLPPTDQAWVGHVFTIITQAFIDAGYFATQP